MRKLIISGFSTILLFSCGPLVKSLEHPTRYLEYSNSSLKSYHKTDKASFQEVHKIMGSRQGGHITYDFIKFQEKLVFPQDSSTFKKLAQDLLFARVQDMKIDSIAFNKFTREKSDQAFGGDIALVNGKIFTTKSNKVFFRRFSVAYLPGLNNNILNLETYIHLKF